MSDNLKQKTLAGASWSFAGQILSRGVNFVIGIILARLLSPTDYGLVGLLGIFLAISQLFIDGGLASALIRTKEPSEEDFSTVYIFNLVLSLFFYSILFFCAPFVASFYEQPVLKPLMRAVALTLVIGSLAAVQGTLLTIRVDFKTKTAISLLSSFLSGVIGIICAYRGMGVWALVAQSVSSAVISTVATLLVVKWFPRLVFSMASFRRLFSYSSKLLGASIISVIYDNAYPMVIGKCFTSADVGLYSRAGQFPGVANGTVVGALNRVAFPILSKIQDDDERLLSVYEKYIQLTCFIVFPLLMMICGMARPMVSFLLTDKWLDCVPLMQILCFSLLTNGITSINLNLLYVKGRSDYVLRLEIIKKSIAFAILFGSVFFGLKGMCLGQVLYSFIALYLNTYYTKRLLGYTFWQQMKSVYPYFLMGLVVLGISLLSTYFIHNSLVSLIVSFVLGALAYWIIAKVTAPYAYCEAKDLVTGKYPSIGKLL